MRERKHGQILLGSLLMAGGLVGVVAVSVFVSPRPEPAALVAPVAGVSAAHEARRGGPPYTLAFATITSGGAVFPDGTMAIVGQPAVGTISNDQYTIEVGAVPILLALTTGNGDLNDDDLIDLTDYRDGFAACVSGPRAAYPADPFCWRFDMDRDDDVDLDDFHRFQAAFGG